MVLLSFRGIDIILSNDANTANAMMFCSVIRLRFEKHGTPTTVPVSKFRMLRLRPLVAVSVSNQ
jgi:hypothetical protein